jgi:phosphohistidine phosphatase SixA
MFLSLMTAVCFAADGPAVVYLVRHAEKAGTKGDVALTEAGQARAVELARVLSDVALDGVHSTDTLRTRSTAEPVASAKQVTVQLYDPRDNGGLVPLLATGTHLVVGHSNTVPGIVEALGGGPVEALEDTTYDRLFLVVRPEQGPVLTQVLHFGAK